MIQIAKTFSMTGNKCICVSWFRVMRTMPMKENVYLHSKSTNEAGLHTTTTQQPSFHKMKIMPAPLRSFPTMWFKTPTRATRSKGLRNTIKCWLNWPPQSVLWMNHLRTNCLETKTHHQIRRHPGTIQKEKEGPPTIKTSTPRAEQHQRKPLTRLNHTRSMHQREMQVSSLLLRC